LHPEQHVHRPPQLRTYTFVLRSELRAPDGVLKRVLTVNGLFPGPTIELRSGDTLRVSVRNELEEGTALHWHGLRFADGTVSQDGTPGLTQCPIPPNGTYTYEFRTSPDQAGTYWYHSHGGAQRADGLWGGLVIHPPAPAAALQAEGGKPQRVHDEPRSRWDSELLLLIGDWFHREGGTMFAWYWNKGSGGNEPVPDNALLNGQQTFDCARSVRRITCTPTAPARPEYTLDPAKTYKLRLVNTGSLAQTFLSVDEHELVVVEADGTDVEPVVARELAIAPGQRYAVILRYLQPQEGQTFWLRHRLDQSCFKYPNFALDPQPKAVIRYSVPRSRLQEPTTERWNVTEADEFDARLLQPLDPAARALPETTMDPLLLYVTTVKFPQNGHLPWGYVNRTSWRPNEREPLLAQLPPADAWLDPATGRPAPDSWGPHEYVVQTSRNETVVVDLIINNLEDGLHPFHLHGHHFWPLHVGKSARYGWGSYNWEYPPTLPTTAPAMRDTMVIPLRSHAVFRVKFDTPGMWLFHCHVLVHLKSGMAMTFDVM
ncbi:multicopper oxidase, partial [Calocera cornea HHB12733]